MSNLNELLKLGALGVLAPLHGLRMVLARRALWPYAAVPFLCGLAWSVLSLANWSLPEGTVWWSMGLSMLLGFFLGAGILLLQVLIAMVSPLFDLLSEQTEEELGTRPRGASFWSEVFSFRFIRSAAVALIEAAKLLGFKLIVYALAAVVSFVPVVGPWLAYPLAGLVTGIDFVDYPFARRQWDLKSKLAIVKAQWPAFFGYGVVFFALLEIPGIGGLALVPAAVGGTWLVAKIGAIAPNAAQATL